MIMGGAPEWSKIKHKFISAYVTDTRLMGAMVVYIHWKEMTEPNYAGQWTNIQDLHQFFYFDPEDKVLDTYKSFRGNDYKILTELENSLLGGLGANKVRIKEHEARVFICHYGEKNGRPGQLPDDLFSEYQFLLEESPLPNLTEKELFRILKKGCTRILNQNQAINYFLMRAFAHDEEGMNFLVNRLAKTDEYRSLKKSEMCKNSIERFYENGKASYLCESLIEHDDNFRVVVSEIKLSKSFKINYCKVLSSFKITMVEAAMIMSKSEYVTTYDIIDFNHEYDQAQSSSFVEKFRKIAPKAIVTEHADGFLFIQFKENNLHVGASEYRLNDDLYCIYYISNFFQLIVTAYSTHSIFYIEDLLDASEIGKQLIPVSKYQFKEPMIYEFIQSEYEDFEEFVSATLRGTED